MTATTNFGVADTMIARLRALQNTGVEAPSVTQSVQSRTALAAGGPIGTFVREFAHGIPAVVTGTIGGMAAGALGLIGRARWRRKAAAKGFGAGV
jgi:hypothetical protein